MNTIVVDEIFFLHTNHLKDTYGALSSNILILTYKEEVKQVDLVFDVYGIPTIKCTEHYNRKSESFMSGIKVPGPEKNCLKCFTCFYEINTIRLLFNLLKILCQE